MAAEQERKERDSARKQAQAERKRRQQQEKEGGGRGRGPGRGRSQRGGRGGADEESEEEEVVDSGPRTAPLTVPKLQERFDELDDDGDGTKPTTPCICALRELRADKSAACAALFDAPPGSSHPFSQPNRHPRTSLCLLQPERD